MTTAFVLSGGGSRGDFQLGAIMALHERGIRPDIITSTSVGSLNAIMLCQGDEGAGELERIWMGLRRNDHMWQFEDWWVEVQPELRMKIVHALNGTGDEPPSSEPWAFHSSLFFGAGIGTVAFGPVGFIAGALVGASVTGLWQSITADAIKDALALVGTRARALLNINPIRAMFDEHFKNDRFKAWANAGGRLRLAAVGLNNGKLAYVTEQGKVLGRDGEALGDGVSVLDGALASASIGAVFPPVSFAGDHWVDGGHREDFPVQAAIDLGADTIYVIGASPLDPVSSVNRTMETPQPPDGPRTFPEDFGAARVTAIGPRALLSIHLDEMARDDVYPVMEAQRGGPRTIHLIAPTYPTHDITTIDPELVRVNADYGYRVASDILDGASDALKADSDQIALAAGKIGRDRAAVLHAIGQPWSARTQGLRDLIAEARARRAAAGLKDGLGIRDALPNGSELTPGDRMLPGQAIWSPDRSYRLIYQSDGNLVLYDDKGGSKDTWANDRMGSALGYAVLQRDGNFVVYDELNNPVWASGTDGHKDCILRLRNDGILALYDGNTVIWKVGRSRKPVRPPRPNTPTVPVVSTATIRNAGPATVQVRIYKFDDTIRAAVLPDGAFDLTPGSERSWTFPTDVTHASAVVNGRHVHDLVPGATVVHSTDDRVELVNSRMVPIFVRLFNTADILRVVALPGGEINLPENGSAFFDMPSDIETIAVMVGGHEVTRARRGERIEISYDPNLYVRNDWDQTVALTFYKERDTVRLITLPNGSKSVAPGETIAFSVPSDVPRVQVRGNGTMAMANPGDTLVIVNGMFEQVV